MFSSTKMALFRSTLLSIVVIFSTAASITIASAQDAANSTQNFGDWTLDCSQSTGCLLFQRTAYQDTGKQISRINITPKADSKNYNMTFVLPLGMSFDKPAEFKLGDRRAKKLTVAHCLPEGCYSAIELNSSLIKKMDRAETGSVEVKTWKGEPFTIPVSPSGIKQGLEALSAQ
jgi:invasion protein IalB